MPIKILSIDLVYIMHKKTAFFAPFVKVVLLKALCLRMKALAAVGTLPSVKSSTKLTIKLYEVATVSSFSLLSPGMCKSADMRTNGVQRWVQREYFGCGRL